MDGSEPKRESSILQSPPPMPRIPTFPQSPSKNYKLSISNSSQSRKNLSNNINDTSNPIKSTQIKLKSSPKFLNISVSYPFLSIWLKRIPNKLKNSMKSSLSSFNWWVPITAYFHHKTTKNFSMNAGISSFTYWKGVSFNWNTLALPSNKWLESIKSTLQDKAAIKAPFWAWTQKPKRISTC